MSDLAAALGLIMALEGALYAGAPAGMKRMLRQMEAMPETVMRVGGLVSLAAGVALVWLIRG